MHRPAPSIQTMIARFRRFVPASPSGRAGTCILKLVRYFLTRRLPEATAILLVESGSRYILENVVGGIRSTWGADIYVDLITCFPGLPEGFPPERTRVYRVADYRGSEGRRRLYRELTGLINLESVPSTVAA